MIQNAGILRKFPDDDDLYLTINQTRLKVKGEDIPRILSGDSRGVFDQYYQRAGDIKLWKRKEHDDLIEIRVFGMCYFIRLIRFTNVWNGISPCCSVQERVHDCWAGFREVVA